MNGMRLHADDIRGEIRPGEAEPIEPGGYHSCGECIAKYSPRIAERLVREGVLAEVSQMTVQYLM